MDDRATIVARVERWAACRWTPPAQQPCRKEPGATVKDTCPLDHWMDEWEAGLALGGSWEVVEAMTLDSAHLADRTVVLEPGTRLRCEQSLWVPGVWVAAYVFRFCVLTGASTGECVLLFTDEDANLGPHGLHPV